MPHAPLSQAELYYELHGSGDPVLLIMGLGAVGLAWTPLLPGLTTHQVCLFDNRGIGRSSAPPPPYRIEHMAQDAVELLAHLDWHRAHVVGISMGGMIAQRLALQAPHRVRSLTLINTHAGGLSARPPRALLRAVPGLVRTRGTAERHRAVAQILHGEAHLSEHGLDKVSSDVARRLPGAGAGTGFWGQIAAVARHRTRGDLHRLRRLPVLVLCGSDDRMVRCKNSYLLAEETGATLRVFDGCGHGLHAERPNEVAAALREHFAEATAQSVSD